MGTNCSVCKTSCSTGYTLNSATCSCVLTNICEAITPCDYGECILGSSADQYTCSFAETISSGVY